MRAPKYYSKDCLVEFFPLPSSHLSAMLTALLDGRSRPKMVPQPGSDEDTFNAHEEKSLSLLWPHVEPSLQPEPKLTRKYSGNLKLMK